MRDSKIRKTGLSFCITLIAIAGSWPFAAVAQTQPPLMTGTPTPLTITPPTIPQITLPVGIQNPLTAVNEQVAQLTAEVTAQVNGIISQQLATLPGLNSLQSIEEITAFLENPSLDAAMQGLSVEAQGAVLDGLLNGSIDPAAMESLIQDGVTSAITGTITAEFPEVAGILNGAITGGLEGAVNAALAEVGTAIGDAIGGAIGDIVGGVIAGSYGTGVTTPAPSISSCGNACNACNTCRTQIPQHYSEVRSTVTSEFKIHRSWLVNNFWLENVLPALMLMAEQLSATGIQQVNMIGMMLDAKHQLETQRLFQQMTAQAHKDYHPSEGMCTFGTTVRSLANSERKSNLAQATFASRMNQRQTMAGEGVSTEGADSDIRSRVKSYIEKYCDEADNANNLDQVCELTAAPERKNIDIDYTRNIESRLTLDADFTTPQNALTTDEQDVFALSANLFSHNIAPRINADELAVADGRIRQAATERYMDLRAIFAKRSVAQNSFAAITSQRAAGSPESAPYTKALIKELGVTEDAEIEKLLGKDPSYFAQMEILTKKIYQSPIFYTELYDKPVNIERKGAALQAIGLMQDRDLYNSLIRTEAVLSVLLETMLQKEQSKIGNAIPGMSPLGGSRQ